MVWAVISFRGKIDLVGIDRKTDSRYYVNILQNSLLPIAEALYEDNWTFLQDIASGHTSNVTTQSFDSYDIDVLY